MLLAHKRGSAQHTSYWLVAAGLSLIVACQRGANERVQSPAPQGTSVTLAVLALPDSTIKLARYAVGTLNGEIQFQQIRNTGVAISSHYARDRRGGGMLEIAIVAALSREVRDTVGHQTIVQLSGWIVERRDTLPLPQRRGRPLTGQRPPLRMVANNPRAISIRDTTDWKMLELVLEEFVRHGAQRLP